MQPQLTRNAHQALLACQGLAGNSGLTVAQPEHLLAALVSSPQFASALLLRSAGFNPDRILSRLREAGVGRVMVLHPPYARVGLRVEELIRYAQAERSLTGQQCVATDHLLIALASSGGTAASCLHAEGVEASALRSALDRLYRDQQPGAAVTRPLWERDMGLPLEAQSVKVAILLPLFCCGTPSLFISFISLMRSDYSVLISAAIIAWMVLQIKLLSGLDSLKRWSWSATIGVLGVRTTAGFAALAMVVANGLSNPSSFGFVSLIPIGIGMSTLLALSPAYHLFKAHEWYSVPRKRAWRTLLREGWWTMLLTFALEFAPLMLGPLLDH